MEECYEFMLAYAGQGLSGKESSNSNSQIRDYLNRAAEALTGIGPAYAGTVQQEPTAAYLGFIAVLERDANDSLAAIQLVLSQPTISSQLVDNLNASIHVRALLTDLFLIDEILKPQQVAANPASSG
jgi:hypothetical protein